MLILDHVCKTVRGKKILDGISARIAHGSIAIFLGPSGVGKSTLLRVLNNLESIDCGTVTLDGETLDLKTVNKRHLIGMVFQHFNLFENLTVRENITIPLIHLAKKSKNEAIKIADGLLTLYELSEHGSRFPDMLSGGQKQRLALARSLALKPKVICLDEPTSALDPLLTAHVARIIKELADNGYIVLIATHDSALVQQLLGATLYLMQDGAIAEVANSRDFTSKKKDYPALDKFISGN